jgi:hypothetical protein
LGLDVVAMEFYGLRGMSHSGQRALTVMSPEGNGAVRRRIKDDDVVVTEAEPGRLTVYYERIAGVLDRLISLHGIDARAKPRWDAKKTAIGDED